MSNKLKKYTRVGVELVVGASVGYVTTTAVKRLAAVENPTRIQKIAVSIGTFAISTMVSEVVSNYALTYFDNVTMAFEKGVKKQDKVDNMEIVGSNDDQAVMPSVCFETSLEAQLYYNVLRDHLEKQGVLTIADVLMAGGHDPLTHMDHLYGWFDLPEDAQIKESSVGEYYVQLPNATLLK